MAALSFRKVINAETLKNSFRRFPASILFTLVLTLYLLVNIWGEKDLFTGWQDGVIIYYLLTGALLSLSLQLWGEEVKSMKTKAIANVVAHAALLGNALYLYNITEDYLSMELTLGNAAAIVALGISVFTTSFFRERDDVPAWNFTLHLIGKAAMSVLTGLVMWGGTALLLSSLEVLFGIDISSECYMTLPVLCCELLPTLLFLGQIPEGEAKHSGFITSSIFVNKVTRYLILPLLGAYLLVLYAYTGKILVEWQLPNGWISYLVSALMAGCLAVEFVLYPPLRLEDKGFNRRVAHLLPLVILPMLLLMTIGIYRRISDYGITVPRLYLLTLNLWFYFVCIGLYLTRARRLHWISISFGLIFLLTSALPVNYAGITRRYTVRHVREVLDTAYHGTLPMSEEQYLDWIVTLPREEALLLNSRLQSLEYDFRDPLVKEIFPVKEEASGWTHIDSPGYYWAANQIKKAHPMPGDDDAILEEAVDTCVDTSTEGAYIRFCGKDTLNLAGISNASIEAYARDSVQVISPGRDSLSLLFPCGESTDTVRISWLDIYKWKGMSNSPSIQTFTCHPSGNIFMLTGIDLSIDVPTSTQKTYKAEISGLRIIKDNK